MGDLISKCVDIVWGPPLMVLLVGTGLYLSGRLSLIQIRGLRHAIQIVTGKFDKKDDPGEITHFRALTTALSATIGTGNIVGVAAAILAGGPGAVFWMWVMACVGMATKYASCTLAVHYRRVDENGETAGGPMHFIERGMGSKFKWLAILFALFTAVASFGIGNMFQINSMVAAVNELVYGVGEPIQSHIQWSVGLLTAMVVSSVILGGIKRIAQVAGVIVPVMCLSYICVGLFILIKNYHLILPGFSLIIEQAFVAPESVSGGLIGGVIRAGVARGLFSNEAGLGSAAMAHGAAKTKEPVREGLVAMLGPLIDTLIVCSITALVIVTTGAYEFVKVKGQLTSAAFEMGLPGSGWIVSVGIILFAFSTLVAWSYYGDRAVDYLFGRKYVVYYRWIFIGFILIGALRKIDEVIDFCDIMNGLMALPNLVALIVLAPVVSQLTQEYCRKNKG